MVLYPTQRLANSPRIVLAPVDPEEASKAIAQLYSNLRQATVEDEAQEAEETAAAIVDQQAEQASRSLSLMPTLYDPKMWRVRITVRHTFFRLPLSI